MKHIITMSICIVLASSIAPQQLIGKSRQKQSASPRESIEDLKKRPDLGVDYGRVARFKLASRKTTYRVGEMISLDLAIINVLDTSLFFHELTSPTIELDGRDEMGTKVPINTYATALEATAPRSYLQIEPGRLGVASFHIVAGCTGDLSIFLDKRDKVNQEEFGRGEQAYFKRVFQDSLFVDWGNACFEVKSPGRYTITAEQTNDTVLESSKTPKMKTAVGTIHSNPLTITITE